MRLHPLNWIQWLTLLLIPAVVVPCTILFVRIQDVQAHQNDALHNIICFVEAAEQRNPHLTALQKRQAFVFWHHALADAHLEPCD